MAVIIHEPRVAAIPLVLDSPHSGTVYPPDFQPIVSGPTLRLAEDTYVADLWRSAPSVGATFIEATFPRSYMDVNRAQTDIDLGSISGEWPWAEYGPAMPSDKSTLGVGLVWVLGKDGAPLYRRALTVQEIVHRINHYWVPYHSALDAAVASAHEKFGQVWHINCHSMPEKRDAKWADAGREVADIVLGDRDASSCSLDFTEFLADFFGQRGYRVAVNDPYKGVELVRKHGQPRQGKHSLQVEIKRSLYMDETTLRKHAGYARVHGHLRELLRALGDFVSRQSNRS
jgi:N-formylglutamate deformylase